MATQYHYTPGHVVDVEVLADSNGDVAVAVGQDFDVDDVSGRVVVLGRHDQSAPPVAASTTSARRASTSSYWLALISYWS